MTILKDFLDWYYRTVTFCVINKDIAISHKIEIYCFHVQVMSRPDHNRVKITCYMSWLRPRACRWVKNQLNQREILCYVNLSIYVHCSSYLGRINTFSLGQFVSMHPSCWKLLGQATNKVLDIAAAVTPSLITDYCYWVNILMFSHPVDKCFQGLPEVILSCGWS